MRILDQAHAALIFLHLLQLDAMLRAQALEARNQGLAQIQRQRRRRRVRPHIGWIRPWLGPAARAQYGDWDNLIPQLRERDPESFLNYMRMPAEMFDEILEAITPRIQKANTKFRAALPAGLKLAVVLRHLATGDNYYTLACAYRISRHTISNFLRSVCQAILDQYRFEYMTIPKDAGDWLEISEQFRLRWNVPHAIGALDGKHVAIRKPRGSGSLYYNYKGFFSVVLLALVDADYKFIWADVGGLGHQSDAQIYNNSELKLEMETGYLDIPGPAPLPHDNQNVPYFILGDDAFALATNMMKPYSLRGLQHSHRIYNYRISRARRVVENAFGILANRFRFLLRTAQQHPDTVITMVQTCMVLHNMLRTRYPHHQNRLVDREDENHQVIPGQWRQDAEMPDLGGQLRGHRLNEHAKLQREYLRRYFNSPAGSVPWQENMI